MNATHEQITHSGRTWRAVAAGSTTEAFGGIAAVVLAIIGLANLAPVLVAAVASLALGVAFLLEGMAFAARLASASETGTVAGEQLEAGLTSELLGGITGIVLGILALLNVVPMTLLPVSLIVYGAVLLLGGGATTRLSSVVGAASERTFINGSALSNGAHVLIGIAALVLGILGVVGIASLVLTLVGFLALGTAILLSGSALSSRVMSFMHGRG